MKMTSYVIASAVIFAVVGLVHLFRLVEGLPLTFGTMVVPAWVSIFGLVVSLGLAVWGFTVARRPLF